MPAKQAPVTRAMGSGFKNLRDMLNGFQQNPNDPEYLKFKTMSKNVVEKIKESYTYDYASTSTQNRRRLHLEEYTSITKGTVKINETDGEEHEDWEDRLWGRNYIADNLRGYVLMISQMLQPRSFSSKSIQFSTLAGRRQSMVYWVIQKCDANVVSIKDVWTSSNRALYLAFRSHNLAVHKEPKLYATKDDMRNLIEFVTYAEPNVEMAQQMVIAWLDGFICGVRPGTIGVTRNRASQFLRWEDIAITREPGGNFNMIITHKWLKGYRDEKLRPLAFSVVGSQYVEDAMFSLPHRLLALAIRRGILRHYKTVDDLLEDSRTKIAFKQSALNQPVVLANSPKGQKLDPDKAGSAAGLTAYLRRVAFDFGLPPNVTMYIWRRSAGTAVGRALGDTKARGFLAHNMQSKVFESAYEQGTIAMDVMNVAMGNRLSRANDLLEEGTLSVNRIQKATNNKAKWTQSWIKEHPEFIKHNTALQKAELDIYEDDGEKNFQNARNHLDRTLRTLRIQAAIAFQELELQLVQDNMTTEEMKKRLNDVKTKGDFEAQLKAAADAARSRAEDEYEPQPEAMEPGDLVDSRDRAQPMAEGENELFLSEDLEDPAAIQTENMSRKRDHSGLPGEVKDAAEVAAVFAANKMLLELLVGQQASDAAATSTCTACEVDETVPNTLSEDFVKDPKNHQRSQYKEKMYKRADLLRHQAGDFHSPKNKWFRSFDDNTANYVCRFKEDEPESEDDDVDGPRCSFFGLPKDMLKHVLRTKHQSDEHLLKAARAGIFARDFDPAQGRALGKVVATGKSTKAGGYGHKAIDDPDTFDPAAFVPPANINSEGEVEESDAVVKYSKTIRLPPQKELVKSTLYKEHPEGVYGRVADILQQQRGFIARRADAILRQHGTAQTEKGETSSKAGAGKGKRTIGTLAANRERLTQLGFDWVAGEDDDEEGGEGEDAPAEEDDDMED